MACDDGCNLKQSPVKKKIIAAASHGFHIFHAQTENLSLKKMFISSSSTNFIKLIYYFT